MSRSLLYFLGLTLMGVVGFVAGNSHFQSTECSGANAGGECDLAAVSGIFWALSAVGLGVFLIVVVETVRAISRRRQRRARLGI